MDDGICDVALVHYDQWSSASLWGETHHCRTKVRLTETIAVIENSIPVREELVSAMSWAISTAVESGTWEPLAAEARLNYTRSPCRETGIDGGGGSPPRMGITDFGALLVGLLLVAIISLAVTRIGIKTEHAATKLGSRKASITPPPQKAQRGAMRGAPPSSPFYHGEPPSAAAVVDSDDSDAEKGAMGGVADPAAVSFQRRMAAHTQPEWSEC